MSGRSWRRKPARSAATGADAGRPVWPASQRVKSGNRSLQGVAVAAAVQAQPVETCSRNGQRFAQNALGLIAGLARALTCRSWGRGRTSKNLNVFTFAPEAHSR